VDTSDFALGTVSLPTFARPDFVDFLWTIPLAIAIAVGAFVILRLARMFVRLVVSREFVLLPLAGLAIAGLAIAFSEAADKPVYAVLFSGEEALPPLVADPGAWSVGALALLIAFKGVAWAISLAGFRGRACVSRAVPGSRRGHDGVAPAGVCAHTRGGRGYGRRDRGRPSAPAFGGDPRGAADGEQRRRHIARHHRRSDSRLSHDSHSLGPAARRTAHRWCRHAGASGATRPGMSAGARA
jgi:hypothetical protein